MSKIYAGTVGLEIIIDMGQNISNAAIHYITARKDGSESTWEASVYESNYLRYVTEDALVAGTYYLHPYITLGGWSGYCEPVSFVVYSKYK